MDFLSEMIYYSTAMIYLVAMYNCAEILLLRQSTSSKLAWILANLLIPFIGVPLYFVLGKNRIRRYTKRRQIAKERWALHKHHVLREASHCEDMHHLEHAMVFDRIFSRYGSVFATCTGRAEIHVDGATAFTSIFQAIEDAKSYVLIQYYIVRSDKIGQQFKDLLIRKARAGVDIYLLYDHVGSFWLPRAFVKELRESGVHVALFQPLSALHRMFRLNFRNHRKLIAVDGQTAFIGGLNIGDEYHGGAPGKAWRDTQIKISGNVVKHLEQVFFEDWHFSSTKHINLDATLATPEGRQSDTPVADHQQYLQVIPTAPTDEDQLGLYTFLALLKTARKRLWIATPYLIPDTATLRLLELRIREGLDVTILIPGHGDSHVVHWVSNSYADYLSRQGCRVLYYTPGFMHQKVILVDDSLTMIGSANFDNRTIYLNFEASILVHDQKFASKMEEILKSDFKFAKPIHDRPENHSIWARLRTGLAMLLAPVM